MNRDGYILKIEPFTRNQYQFESCLPRGIILRLIEFCYGTNYLTNPTQIMKRYLSWNFAEKMRFSPYRGRTLHNPLQFVRDVLDLPDTVPILLAIDELAMKQKKEDMIDLKYHIWLICSELDKSKVVDVDYKRNRTFWLSFSAYRCDNLVEFINYSHRPRTLQPLPPIFPIKIIKTLIFYHHCFNV